METENRLFKTTIPYNSINSITDNKLAIVGISISLFMMNLDTSIVSVGLPTIIKDFNTNFVSGQWFVLIYLLVLTALLTAAGRLGDIIGKKRLYLGGIAIFTTASLLCGIAFNAALLTLFRGLQGIGAALILSLSMAIATELTPKNQLGRTMGILSTITALGIASGPTVGGLLLSTFGWQSMFLVNIPFGIIAYWLAYKFMNTTGSSANVSIDWAGIILLAIVLSSYCISMTMIEQKGFRNPVVLILGATTVIALLAFIRFEKKIAYPLLNLSIFKNKLISRNLIATVLVYTVIITTVILPPFYLSKAAGYNPLKVGLIMSFGPLLMVTLSVYAGKIADRYGAKKVMFYAVLAIAVGCFSMSTITPSEGIPGYLWRIAIIAMGLNFFKTPNNTVIMEVAQPDQRGLLSGVLSLARIVGQITGTAVLGVIFGILSGSSNTTQNPGGTSATTSAFDSIFLINAIIVLFAALLIYPASLKKKPSDALV